MPRRPPDPLYILQGRMESVSCLTYGPRELIYAGTQNGFVHVWDLKTNRERCLFQAGDSTCLSIHVFVENIVTQIKGGLIIMWMPNGEKFLKQHEINVPYFGFCKIELYISLNNTHIFSPSENSEIKMINMKKVEILNSFSEKSVNLGEVMTMKQSVVAQNSVLIAGYESGHIILWDVDQCEKVSQIKFEATPMAIDFDAEKRMGLCGTELEKLFVFSCNENNNLSLFKTITITNPGVSCIQIREDHKIFVLGCWDGHIRVFSWKSLHLLAVLTVHSETLHDLCFSPEAIPSWKCRYLLAAGCKDKSISLWSIYEN